MNEREPVENKGRSSDTEEYTYCDWGAEANSSPSPELSLECWENAVQLECLGGSRDLQLAAELGKTLLDRNKDLEANLKHQQNVIDDQTQEIEYLSKQTAALKEVNDSRMKIYEQLEVGIQDLEDSNEKLTLQNERQRKEIKGLSETIGTLETQCEELQVALNKLQLEKRSENLKFRDSAECARTTRSSVRKYDESIEEDKRNINMILTELQECKIQRTKDKKRINDLENQIANILQEADLLEERLNQTRQKEKELKGIREELATLEKIRQGYLCNRCLRAIDSYNVDASSVITVDDDLDSESAVDSLVESRRREALLQMTKTSSGDKLQEDNPYEVLVEKYEALLEIQKEQRSENESKRQKANPDSGCEMSLQQELMMSGDYSEFRGEYEDSDPEFEHSHPEHRANNSAVHSDGETSSSGFSERNVTKGTQTTESLLCEVSSGNAYRLSIYDNARGTIDSSFQRTPEYKNLFEEIFSAIRNGLRAKEVERLKCANDSRNEVMPNAPPATPVAQFAALAPQSTTLDAQPTAIASHITVATTHFPSLGTKENEAKIDGIFETRAIKNLAPFEECKITPSQEAREIRNERESLRWNILPHVDVRQKRKKCKDKKKLLAISDLEFISASCPSSPRKSRGRKKRDSSREAETNELHPPLHPKPPADFSGNRINAGSALEGITKLKMLDKTYADALKNGNKKSK